MSIRCPERQIVESITCKQCGHFLGIVTSDGRGPILDDCPAATEAKKGKRTTGLMCEMLAKLAQYQPLGRPTQISGHSGPLDEDAGSYGAIARRALEDTYTDNQ